MKKKFSAGLLVFLAVFSLWPQDGPQKSLEDQRRETLQYGTENEIAELIRTLRNEASEALDDEILEAAKDMRNGAILASVFAFFAGRDKAGLEEKAKELLECWDEQTPDAVRGALDYLGRLRDTDAVDGIMDLADQGDSRYISSAIRALGRVGSALTDRGESDTIAGYLVSYYEDKNPNDDTMREIILALGELKNPNAVDFLNGIAGNAGERPARRMAALQSLSKIASRDSLDVVLEALRSPDPNIRSTAVAALGPFTGREVDQAILEAFRDSYYRSRIGAAQAAAERKLTEAIPYLRYRAERDEVAAVRTEAVKALGAMDNNEAFEIIAALFLERKNSDSLRIIAGETLITNRPGEYAEAFIAELDDANARNQTALYNQFARIIAQAETGRVEALALRFFSTGGVVERSYAIDMVYRNRFMGLIDQVKELTDEKYGSLSRKARETLQKMGISYEE